MTASRILALSVALGMLTAASADAANHQNQHQDATQGQSSAVRHPARAARRAAARAAKPVAARAAKPVAATSQKPDVSAAAGAAYGSATDPQSTLDALAVQHKNKDWHSNHESWCDVNPDCSGWNKNMESYEQTIR